MKLLAIVCVAASLVANAAAFGCHSGDPNKCWNGNRFWSCASGGVSCFQRLIRQGTGRAQLTQLIAMHQRL
ncbi:hypothetical protein F4821DRAFT_246828 [Hypoxylon rubiginosum]|uniref:Uncharacterized protein n=1 Tax=Hypoxylon rubiginosum TaxID=110542 RepID=A0ACC0CQM1_9PEZI|nr:hypothetical protein F4821DRAFT_246828 [Hypoxylon rubiginosum]